MDHIVARSTPGTLLFRTWTEAQNLWDRLVEIPAISALVLMPNHIHLLAPDVSEQDFTRRMSGYARWRTHRRGVRGPVWQPHPPFHEMPDSSHTRRTRRYIHLNPCRAGLVDDPLAWPFSTHRDATGLTVDAVVKRSGDAVAFHAYVSADPTVCVEGTWLPQGSAGPRTSLDEVEAAVSALTRSTFAPAGPGTGAHAADPGGAGTHDRQRDHHRGTSGFGPGLCLPDAGRIARRSAPRRARHR